MLPSDDGRPQLEGGVDTRAIRAVVGARLFGGDELVRIGRYAIVQRLGSGGMGVVYAAHDAELDRRIAVKLLHREVWTDDAARERMRREAQAMARLNHPNVATVHEVGDHDGAPYVAMEFVEGMTLREWLVAEPRHWRATLGVYVQAGRGLAAAHAVGLVHRDFKPDNAMLGRDERVRVTDFGLARGVDAPAGAAQPTTLDEPPITRSSAVGGTPAYMAPEQFAGDAGDAKVDQFAFCVSLWEALTGERPFAGDSLLRLADAVTRGELRPGWPDKIPRWIRSVLVRGLAVEPAQRWPDMPAVVAELEDDPSRRRVRRMVLGGLALTGIAVAVGLQVRHLRRVAACDAAADVVDEQWNPTTIDTLRAGLVATGADGAGEAFDRARPWIDDYVERWKQLRRGQCTASSVDGTRDAALAQASITCLEQRRSALAGVLGVWAEPDALLVQRLVHGATGLPVPESCVDDGYVLRRTAPPTDPQIAASVEGVRARIDRARALETAGRTKPALLEATETRSEAEALGWPPLVAEAMAEQGRLADRNGASAEAEAALRGAFSLAHANGADEIAASAATSLTYALANVGKLDEALQWSELARAAVARTGASEGPMGASGELTTGYVYQQRGEFEQALAHYHRAIELRERLFGSEHPSVAIAYQHVGLSEYSQEHREQAKLAFERTLAINLAVFGEHHPAVAHSRDALGVLLNEQGEYDQALVQLEAARAVRAEAFGEHSVWVAQSLHNIGNVWLARGRYREALDHYTRASAVLRELRGADHPDLVLGLCNIGLAHSALGEREAALASFREALRIQEAALSPEHPETARVLVYLAGELVRADDPQAALAPVERAEAIATKVFGADHMRTIDAVQVHGEALVRLGRAREAIPVLERALVANDATPVDPNDGAYTRFSLARALWDADRDRDRALALARTAELMFADDSADPQALAEVRAWLLAHAG